MTDSGLPPRILLIEDDISLMKGLEYALEKEGFTFFWAGTLEEGRKRIRQEECDIILLDVNLPDGNGFDFCRETRRTVQVPVIFLTACDEEFHVVMGLDLGGDDYITKPFRVNELISRIHAVLRRSSSAGSGETVLRCGDIVLNRKTSKVTKNGEDLFLTATEFRLISVLLGNRGNIITRERLMSLLWDSEEHYIDSNTLSVYIRRLRTKIEEDPGCPEYIETVREWGTDGGKMGRIDRYAGV